MGKRAGQPVVCREDRRVRRWSRFTGYWFGLALGIFLLAGLTLAYALLQVRHEQELRVMGRRVRQVETRLRQTEIRLHLAQQENQRLHSDLACQQAALAMIGGGLGKTQHVQVARAR